MAAPESLRGALIKRPSVCPGTGWPVRAQFATHVHLWLDLSCSPRVDSVAAPPPARRNRSIPYQQNNSPFPVTPACWLLSVGLWYVKVCLAAHHHLDPMRPGRRWPVHGRLSRICCLPRWLPSGLAQPGRTMDASKGTCGRVDLWRARKVTPQRRSWWRHLMAFRRQVF